MIIYYFSATGNSLKAALDIAGTDDKTIMIPIKPGTGKTIPAGHDKIGFVFPVYMGALPGIVKQFLTDIPVQPDVYYFSVVTYYLYKGVALSIVDHILKKKGARLHYGNSVSTVGNCLMEYEVPDRKREPLLQKANEKMKVVSKEINDHAENKISRYCPSLAGIHVQAFRIIFGNAGRKFTVENNCNGCGSCEKVCPVKNISMENHKPKWGDNCEACHACVHWCPRNAINLGRSKGRLQYHHPGIRYPEIGKRIGNWQHDGKTAGISSDL